MPKPQKSQGPQHLQGKAGSWLWWPCLVQAVCRAQIGALGCGDSHVARQVLWPDSVGLQHGPGMGAKLPLRAASEGRDPYATLGLG